MEPKTNAAQEAIHRALELRNRWVTCLVLDRLAGEVFADLIKAQARTVLDGRCLAFFNPKCDDEARVLPSRNYYRCYPPINKDRFDAFCRGIDVFMVPGRDIVAVVEGTVWSNRTVILETIAKTRAVSLTYKEHDFVTPTLFLAGSGPTPSASASCQERGPWTDE